MDIPQFYLVKWSEKFLSIARERKQLTILDG